MSKHEEKEIIDVETVDAGDLAPVTEKEEKELMVYGAVSECTKLRLRREPVVGDNVIGELKFADVVIVDLAKSTTDFYKVITEAGVEGYCMRQYINVAE